MRSRQRAAPERDTLKQDIAEALMGSGNLSVTSKTDTSKVGLRLGASIETIMQSAAPAAAPGQTTPMTDEEFMRLKMAWRATRKDQLAEGNPV